MKWMNDNMPDLAEELRGAENDVFVDPSLGWHYAGCVKRYGAVSDGKCQCESDRENLSDP